MNNAWRDRWVRGYQLKDILGSGGFGVVYLAHQPTVEREVAIKAVLPDYANQVEFIRRFEKEAQFIARLEHLHIVPLYDFWREPNGAYLVMRLFKGGSVKTALEQRGAFSLAAAAKLVGEIASALTLAHANGIVHQDLKPENILLDELGNAYLVDFGIAKDVIKNVNLSEAGRDRIFGTPAYMAPEQLKDMTATPQSDIYSLALIIYSLITGAAPYTANDLTTILRQKIFEILPPVSLVRPDLPDELNLMLWRATDVTPHNRHTDVLALATEFKTLVNEAITAGEPPSLLLKGQYTIHPTLPLSTTHLLPRSVKNPYKGLRAFEEADALDFFGREALTEKLLNRITTSRFLAVIGPSGSGKSSVVKAGVIPALRQGKIESARWWFISSLSPAAAPLVELEQALMRVAIDTPTHSIAEQIHTSDTALHEILGQLLPPNGELLLFINQFEELFTLTADETLRHRWLANLTHAVTHPDSRLRVILTLRADFYDRPLHYADFGALIREHTEVVLPLSPSEIELAIDEPAKAVGLTVDRDLLVTMIEDVRGQPGMLPLLQFALTELYNHREGHQLTLTAYQAIGGVRGALAQRANELYESLEANQQTIAQQIFLRLITPGDDTRRRVLRSELMGTNRAEVESLLDLFGQYRLLTFDHDPVTRAPTIEIAHEALIHGWQHLRAWLETNRERLYVHRRLTEAASEWHEKQDSGFLASGARLAQFEDLLTGQITFNEAENAYLQASIAHRQRSARRTRFFMLILTVTALGALLMAGLAFVGQAQATHARRSAESERDRANQQASISRSRELAVSALTEGDRLDKALLMSMAALEQYDTVEARRSLLISLTANPYLEIFLHGHTGKVRTAAATHTVIASAGDDRTIRLWDANTLESLGEPLTGHEQVIWKIAIHPDGTHLASASHDGTVRLWNITQPDSPPQILAGHTDKVWDVVFSPDGRWLASASSDHTVIVWDTQTLTPRILEGHTDEVYALAFRPDGQQLASGGADNTVILWDMSARASTEPITGTLLSGHQNWILTLAYHPDGSLLVSSGVENQVYAWDSVNQVALGQFPTNHTDWIRKLIFTPDGQRIITASADNSIRVWDFASAQLAQAPLTGHTDAIWDLAFWGEHLLSASSDQSVVLWTFQPQQPLATLLPTQTTGTPAWSVTLAGCQLAVGYGSITGSSDFSVRVWESICEDTLNPPTLLAGHTAMISGVASNKEMLVSASADRTLITWSWLTGETITILQAHTGSLTSVALHPNGREMASTDSEGTIIFWEQSAGGWQIRSQLTLSSPITSLAYRADGSFLAAGNQANEILLFENGQQVGTPLSAHTDDIETVIFSPDGQLLASGSRDNTIILWEVTTRQPIAPPLTAHTNWVTALAFSPDGNMLVSGSRDTSLIFWDVTTRQPFSPPLYAHTDWVTDTAFSEDGQVLVSSGRDGQVFVWAVTPAAWEKLACRTAHREFTADEWKSIFFNLSQTPLCP